MAHANLFLDVLKSGNTHSLPISTAWSTFSVPWNTITTDIWDGKKTASQIAPKDLAMGETIFRERNERTPRPAAKTGMRNAPIPKN